MSGRLRLRLVVACVLLVGLAFVQDPGFLVPDTKFDLVIDPGGFLGRSLHLWDGQGFFGQLQNQAYGYLWPMGPFFLLGHLLDAPGWVVQRLWLGMVMSVALVGAARVSRALGVRSDLACIVAGFAYALSPRMLTTLGPISIEAWPSALAPWVLLPLVLGSVRGSPRRAAILSAAAVAMVGGVNAAATFAVIPLGVVWLLTRAPGPRRRALMTWWPVFTLLGTLWWLVPLFLVGAYSPPFLDYIETTTVTTFPTTLFDVLRGTSDWVPYIDASSRAGNDLVTTSYLALNSAVVLSLGLVGMMLRRNPHRTFLVLSVLVGVLMVTAGHRGAVEGWFAPEVRSLLDGTLAPLRNVHKFDPIVRLPMVVALAMVIDRVLASRAGAGHTEQDGSMSRADAQDVSAGLGSTYRVVVVAMVLTVVAGSAVPALLGRVTPSGATLAVPDYWSQTADWLGDNSVAGTALVVPGSTFANYVWGAPRDEPLQYLSSSRWAVRNVIPLTPPGTIRMFDEVEDRLAQGEGSAGFSAYLRRAGVEFLVVRNDLATGDDVPLPVVVHQTLEQSPGLTEVASFGPDVGGGSELPSGDRRVVVNGGWQTTYPAVEIFRVEGGDQSAVVATTPTTVAGGPEDLLDLQDLGVIGSGPTELAADARSQDVQGGGVVLTDGLRARERFFARIHDGASASITPGDVRRSGSPAQDYEIGSGNRWATTVRLDGARSLSASSSRSDSNTIGGSDRGQLPYAAVDSDDEGTQWVSGPGQTGQAWWRIDLDSDRVVSTVRLTGGDAAPEEQVVRVRVASGASQSVELGPGETRSVSVPRGATGWVRVEDASGAGRQLALADVEVPGVDVRRTLVTPVLPKAWGSPRAVVLRADLDSRHGCIAVSGDVRCLTGRVHADEEGAGLSRSVTLPRAQSWTPELRVRPRAGRALDELVLAGQPLDVTASSVAVPDTRASPVAAVDGDDGTTWMADPADLRPTLTMSWLGRKRVTGVDLSLARGTAARLPTKVELTWPGGTREVDLTDGRGSFPALRTDQLRLQVLASEQAVSLGFDSQLQPVGVGITELALTGVDYLPLGLSADPTELACGTGPDVELDGRSWRTTVTASPRQLAAGADADAQMCGAGKTGGAPVALQSGANDLTATWSSAFALHSLVLRDPTETTSGFTVGQGPSATSPVERVIRPTSGATVIGLRENTSAGWVATQAGHRLSPVVLDGWQQGWVLRDDESEVSVVFAADRTYRAGLAVGAGGALLLLLAMWGTTRRSHAGGVLATSAPLASRRVPTPLLVICALAASGVLAGWGGVAAAVGVSLAARLWRDLDSWAVLVAPCLVVGVGYAIRPWGSSAGWAGAQAWGTYAMLVPLVAVLVASTVASPSRTTPRRRWAGRSTRR